MLERLRAARREHVGVNPISLCGHCEHFSYSFAVYGELVRVPFKLGGLMWIQNQLTFLRWALQDENLSKDSEIGWLAHKHKVPNLQPQVTSWVTHEAVLYIATRNHHFQRSGLLLTALMSQVSVHRMLAFHWWKNKPGFIKLTSLSSMTEQEYTSLKQGFH